MNCDSCLKFNIWKKGYHPATTTASFERFYRIGFDYIEFPKDRNDFKYCLTILDYFSEFVILKPMKDKSADSTAVALHETFSILGFPSEIISDSGREFTNQVVHKLTSIFNIDHKRITPYYHQALGKVERKNGTIRSVMNKLTKGNFDYWSFLLISPCLLSTTSFILVSTIHLST